MGWAIGYDGRWERDIGYGVPAVCDHPDCNVRIDRGLDYVCNRIEYTMTPEAAAAKARYLKVYPEQFTAMGMTDHLWILADMELNQEIVRKKYPEATCVDNYDPRFSIESDKPFRFGIRYRRSPSTDIFAYGPDKPTAWLEAMLAVSATESKS